MQSLIGLSTLILLLLHCRRATLKKLFDSEGIPRMELALKGDTWIRSLIALIVQ
jgi:hypothetical protein